MTYKTVQLKLGGIVNVGTGTNFQVTLLSRVLTAAAHCVSLIASYYEVGKNWKVNYICGIKGGGGDKNGPLFPNCLCNTTD